MQKQFSAPATDPPNIIILLVIFVGAPKSVTNKLQRVSNAAARVVSGTGNLTVVSGVTMGWLLRLVTGATGGRGRPTVLEFLVINFRGHDLRK